jgi:hypothetical protein
VGALERHLLQINNVDHAPAEGKHSMKEIMKTATALPALSCVNNDNNIDARREVGSWDWGIPTR